MEEEEIKCWDRMSRRKRKREKDDEGRLVGMEGGRVREGRKGKPKESVRVEKGKMKRMIRRGR